MAHPLIRWSLQFSLLVGVVAVFLRYQYPLGTKGETEATYCYQGVRADASDASQSEGASCFTVANGQFTRVFAKADDGAVSTAITETQPGYVLPGLWDGHGHLMAYGEFLHSVNLFGTSSADDVRSRLRTYLDAHPDAGGKDEWLRGTGWDQMALGGMPTAVRHLTHRCYSEKGVGPQHGSIMGGSLRLFP